MKRLDKLGLYSHVFPALLERPGTDQLLSNGDDYIAEDGRWHPEEANRIKAEIFDCRQLPVEFLLDAGEASFHELEQLRELPRLPYTQVYFEFGDKSAAHIHEMQILADASPDDIDPNREPIQMLVEMTGYPSWEGIAPERYADVAFPQERVDMSGTGEEDFYTTDTATGTFHPKDEPSEHWASDTYFDGGTGDSTFLDRVLHRQKHLTLGALTLLQEKLVLETIEQDPAPRLTAARTKRGLPPVSGRTHVLRVNVPAVRRLARSTPLGHHESPLLHWRRGHWRVLHRGSEFESKTWVRKCLCGDPSKGYLRKDYRLTFDQPMLQPVEPSPPIILGA